MNDDVRDDRPAPARALQQLPAAVAAALLFVVSADLGMVLLVVLALLWPPAVRWRPLAAGRVLLSYLPFAVLWFAFVWLYLHGLAALGHTVAPQPMLQELARDGAASEQFGLKVVGIVVLAPFFEELLFRGYLFSACVAARLPNVATQLLVAALFGLVHGLDYALPIGVLALLFGWLRQRHDALLPSMFAHAVHNGLTVAVTLVWPGHLDILYPR